MSFDDARGGRRWSILVCARNPHPACLAAATDWASRLHRARRWSPAERDAAGLEFR
jgi:hypothetical protein